MKLSRNQVRKIKKLKSVKYDRITVNEAVYLFYKLKEVFKYKEKDAYEMVNKVAEQGYGAIKV